MIVDEVNGKPVRSMEDLRNALLVPLEKGEVPEFVVIKVIGSDRPVVIEGAKVMAAHQRVLEKYNVGQAYSAGGRVGEGLSW